VAKSQLGCLSLRTHQHYHHRWLSDTEWWNFRRSAWLWREGIWWKVGFKMRQQVVVTVLLCLPTKWKADYCLWWRPFVCLCVCVSAGAKP